MYDDERRRRDDGLATVRAWTRRAAGLGLALTAGLGVAGWYLAPGKSAATVPPPVPPVVTESPAPSVPPSGDDEEDEGRGGGLAPPQDTPAPAPPSPHATSGGS